MRYEVSESRDNFLFVHWAAIRLAESSTEHSENKNAPAVFVLFKWPFKDSVRYKLARSCATVWECLERDPGNLWDVIRSILTTHKISECVHFYEWLGGGVGRGLRELAALPKQNNTAIKTIFISITKKNYAVGCSHSRTVYSINSSLVLLG